MDALIAELLKNFGPTGVVAAIGIYALRALMPLAIAAVGHLGRVADAVEKTAMGIQVVDAKVDQLRAELGGKLDRLADEVDENGQDLAGLYGALGKKRESRAAPALKGATAGD